MGQKWTSVHELFVRIYNLISPFPLFKSKLSQKLSELMLGLYKGSSDREKALREGDMEIIYILPNHCDTFMYFWEFYCWLLIVDCGHNAMMIYSANNSLQL